MTKRIFLVVLCLLMVLGMAVGCTGNGEGGNNEGGETGDELVISIGMWPEDTNITEVENFENYKAIFEEKYPGVKIEPDHYDYAVDTFVAIAEGGNVPTVFECWYTEPEKLIASGYIRDITAQLEEKGWIEKMNDQVRDIISDDAGNIYGVPRDSYGLGVVLNLELYEQAGLIAEDGTIDYPTTLDELSETAGLIREKTGQAGIVILTSDNTGGWHFSNIAWNFGADLQYKDDSGKWISNLNSPEAVEALKWVYDLKWEKDALPPDVIQNWYSGWQRIGTNEAAMYFGAADGIGTPVRDFKISKDSLAFISFPAGKESHSLMGGNFYAFAANATEEQVTAALNFLEVMGKAPVYNEVTEQGMRDDYETAVNDGVPVIPAISAWDDAEYNAAVDALREEYTNIDFERCFSDYYTKTPGILRAEEENDSQKLYASLDPAIQEVISNKDADLQGLLDKAAADYQKVLDESFN